MAIWGYLLLALGLGALLPLQVGANAELAQWLGAAVRASIVNFVVGGIALVAVTLAFFRGWPQAESIVQVPGWGWVGGFVGASYVLGSTLAGPRLGAVTFFALILAGQTVASVLVDHFGWIGFETHPLSLGRVAGIALLAAGVVLVRVF